MIELRTLGAVDLRGADGVEVRTVLVQPRRTALLVYLAVATPRGFHRRDSLLALFWPESDAPHARNTLRQLLHGLRQALGGGVVLSRGDAEVGLDASRCSCDVGQFELALDAGDLERAAGLYRGPFLQGFFLSDAPEFQLWVEAERERLSRRYAEVLERLAHAAESRADYPSAVRWWSCLAQHTPYTSRVTLNLMRALDRAGDRATAIRHAEQHTALLKVELDAEPDPEVEALAARLRTQPARRAPHALGPSGPEARLVEPDSRTPGVPVARRASRRAARLAVVALLSVGVWRAVAAGRAPARPLERIAVLPLTNQTGDTAQQYLVDGVHEAVITELAQIHSLSVISRSSVVRYRGTSKTVPEIARELRVEALVEGAVFRAGDHLRITLQLIDATRDHHLWARTFEGDVARVLQLSDEAARDIARGARATLTPEDVARLSAGRTVNPGAQAAYLRGRWQFNRNDAAGYRRAVAFYQEAIGIDSSFAPAYAGLADVALILGHEDGSSTDAIPRARAIARQALQRDPALGDAYAVMGHVAFEYDWDWAEAEHLFRQAIALDPSNARAHLLFGGGFLLAMARFAEARQELRLAAELDPLSPTIAAVATYPARFAGRLIEAEAGLQAARQVFPDDREVLTALGLTHEAQGRHAEAIDELRQAGAAAGLRAWAFGCAGQRDSARAILRRLEEQQRREALSPWQLALASVGAGERRRALDYLEAAERGRVREMAWLKVFPYFTTLRDEPRYQALVARLRFPG